MLFLKAHSFSLLPFLQFFPLSLIVYRSSRHLVFLAFPFPLSSFFLHSSFYFLLPHSLPSFFSLLHLLYLLYGFILSSGPSHLLLLVPILSDVAPHCFLCLCHLSIFPLLLLISTHYSLPNFSSTIYSSLPLFSPYALPLPLYTPLYLSLRHYHSLLYTTSPTSFFAPSNSARLSRTSRS